MQQDKAPRLREVSFAIDGSFDGIDAVLLDTLIAMELSMGVAWKRRDTALGVLYILRFDQVVVDSTLSISADNSSHCVLNIKIPDLDPNADALVRIWLRPLEKAYGLRLPIGRTAQSTTHMIASDSKKDGMTDEQQDATPLPPEIEAAVARRTELLARIATACDKAEATLMATPEEKRDSTYYGLQAELVRIRAEIAPPAPEADEYAAQLQIDKRTLGFDRIDQKLAERRAWLLAAIAEARDSNQQSEPKPTPEDVIRKYYRRHARNSKITLKQVCEEFGVNYASIRVAKVAYDKRRKRGQKD